LLLPFPVRLCVSAEASQAASPGRRWHGPRRALNAQSHAPLMHSPWLPARRRNLLLLVVARGSPRGQLPPAPTAGQGSRGRGLHSLPEPKRHLFSSRAPHPIRSDSDPIGSDLGSEEETSGHHLPLLDDDSFLRRPPTPPCLSPSLHPAGQLHTYSYVQYRSLFRPLFPSSASIHAAGSATHPRPRYDVCCSVGLSKDGRSSPGAAGARKPPPSSCFLHAVWWTAILVSRFGRGR
jgi:hypothetical protein